MMEIGEEGFSGVPVNTEKIQYAKREGQHNLSWFMAVLDSTTGITLKGLLKMA